MCEENLKPYNYKNCQSLFGYAQEVHIRCKGKCQLCGCGGLEPEDFAIWRQMTVEHLIGKSQGGYLNQIKASLKEYHDIDDDSFAKELDTLNTVSACQFCNSTTSRDSTEVSMSEIIKKCKTRTEIKDELSIVCKEILQCKKKKVEWKLTSVKKAFLDLKK